MNVKLLFSAIALGTAVMVGCDESSTVADKAADAAKDASAAAKDAAGAAKDAAGAAKDSAASAAAAAGDMAADAAEMLKDPKAAFDKLQGLIDSKNWTDAKSLLDKIMALKDKLPAEWSSKLESLSKLVEDGVKSMGGK